MRKADVVTAIITYIAAFSALEKAAQWQQARGFLLAGARKADAVTVAFTYRAAVSACEKASQ